MSSSFGSWFLSFASGLLTEHQREKEKRRREGKVLRVLPLGRRNSRNQGCLNFWETKLVTVRKSLHSCCWGWSACLSALGTLDRCAAVCKCVSARGIMGSSQETAPLYPQEAVGGLKIADLVFSLLLLFSFFHSYLPFLLHYFLYNFLIKKHTIKKKK